MFERRIRDAAATVETPRLQICCVRTQQQDCTQGGDALIRVTKQRMQVFVAVGTRSCSCLDGGRHARG
jgi:uncharacterized protein (DUF2249 family)